MRKLLLSVGLFCVLSLSTSIVAADPGMYIGIGGSYNWDSFSLGELEEGLTAIGVDQGLVFENTWGLNLEAGYALSDSLTLGLDLGYVDDFEITAPTWSQGIPVTLSVKVELVTFMAVAKYSLPIGPRDVRPFIVGGIGLMTGDTTATVSGNVSVFLSESDSESDLCAKIGLGAEFLTTENLSIVVEGGSVLGTGEMEDIQYLRVAAGVTYRF